MGPPGELRNGGAFESFIFVHGSTRQRREEVCRLNVEHAVWGWKEPMGVEALRRLPKGVRDVRCVFIFRDPMATAHSYMRHAKEDFLKAWGFVWPLYQELVDTAMQTDRPSVLVSYERIRADPEAFVAAMDEFSGVGASLWERKAAVARVAPLGGYLRMPDAYGYPPTPQPHLTPERWEKNE
jgi:hypothetical protein